MKHRYNVASENHSYAGLFDFSNKLTAFIDDLTRYN